MSVDSQHLCHLKLIASINSNLHQTLFISCVADGLELPSCSLIKLFSWSLNSFVISLLEYVNIKILHKVHYVEYLKFAFNYLHIVLYNQNELKP